MNQLTLNAFSGFRPKTTSVVPQIGIQSPSLPALDYYSGMVQATDQTFESVVLEASWRKPTLAHFYNRDCGDCADLLAEMAPIAESMSPGGSIKFVKIEDEWNPESSDRFARQAPVNLSIASLREDEEEGLRINSHPLVLFRYGEMMDEMSCNDRRTRLDALIRDTIRREDHKLFPKPQPTAMENRPAPSQGWVAWVKSLLGLTPGQPTPSQSL